MTHSKFQCWGECFCTKISPISLKSFNPSWLDRMWYVHMFCSGKYHGMVRVFHMLNDSLGEIVDVCQNDIQTSRRSGCYTGWNSSKSFNTTVPPHILVLPWTKKRTILEIRAEKNAVVLPWPKKLHVRPPRTSNYRRLHAREITRLHVPAGARLSQFFYPCTVWCSEIGPLTSLMHVTQVQPVTTKNQFHCTRLYFKCSVHWTVEDRLWECRLQEVWHFRHEQKIFGHPKFLWQEKKIIKFWGIRHLQFKNFLGELPQTPAKCNPLSNTLATCLSSVRRDVIANEFKPYRVGLWAQANLSAPTFEPADEARTGQRAALSV